MDAQEAIKQAGSILDISVRRYVNLIFVRLYNKKLKTPL